MTTTAKPAVERVTVLHEYTSPETALRVENIPYGSFGNKRTTFRYWIETCEKGPKKGHQRFVYQTTNPDKPGEVWNKPKPSNYSEMVVMYRDAEGTIGGWHISAYRMHGVDEYRNRLSGVYEQLTDDQRQLYDYLRSRVRAGSPTTTVNDDHTLAAVINHIRDTGENPPVDNGYWVNPDGSKYLYLGFDGDSDVILDYARSLMKD